MELQEGHLNIHFGMASPSEGDGQQTGNTRDTIARSFGSDNTGLNQASSDYGAANQFLLTPDLEIMKKTRYRASHPIEAATLGIQ
jgi:hypothetical protein